MYQKLYIKYANKNTIFVLLQLIMNNVHTILDVHKC